MHVASVMWQVDRRSSRKSAGRRASSSRVRSASLCTCRRTGSSSPPSSSSSTPTISAIRCTAATTNLVLLYLSVLVHELSHSIVARGYGLPVRRILLYPLGGVSEIEKEPQTPAREFLVSAAGPVVSLLLGAAGWGLTKVWDVGIPGSLVRQLM